MSKAVQDFEKAKKSLMKQFKCPDDYFVKFLGESEWTVSENEGIYFLTYWDNDKRSDAVVVKKGEKPLIYKGKDETMIVAIDCVKIAFVVKNHRAV